MEHKINIVKHKEEYVIHNNAGFPIVYNIIPNTCNVNDQVTVSGNLPVGETYTFVPCKDGDYTVQYSYVDSELKEHFAERVIAHYPILLKSFVSNVEKMLCGCGCEDSFADKGNDCTSPEAKQCLKHQNLYGEAMLVFGFVQTLASCTENKNVIFEAYASSLDLYKCELYSLFCAKEVDLKISGTSEHNAMILKKAVSILYTLLYFYEKEISKQEPEFIDFVKEKYKWKTIKPCILKAEIDLLEVEHLFMASFYDGCSEDEYCSIGCFVPTIEYFNKDFVFPLNTDLNGIYDTVTLKNTCGTAQLYNSFVLYRDATFKVVARPIAVNNPANVEPGTNIDVNIIFIGKKSEYTVINTPFTVDGEEKGKYRIVFRDEEVIVNTPPVISDVVKQLTDRNPYTFTIADFESNFFDADGDTLDKIVLVGDTSRFTLGGVPYVSGTVISRVNITQLVYTPSMQDDAYQLILNWKAYDSRGASNI